MLGVIKDIHLRRDCFGSNKEIVVRVMSGTIDFSLVVDLLDDLQQTKMLVICLPR